MAVPGCAGRAGKGHPSLPARIQAGLAQFQRAAGPEHKKKCFKIPSLVVFAIYILCRSLKTKRDRCRQIRSDGVAFGDFFFPWDGTRTVTGQQLAFLCHIRVLPRVPFGAGWDFLSEGAEGRQKG